VFIRVHLHGGRHGALVLSGEGTGPTHDAMLEAAALGAPRARSVVARACRLSVASKDQRAREN
jgi:hypothetical protein